MRAAALDEAAEIVVEHPDATAGRPDADVTDGRDVDVADEGMVPADQDRGRRRRVADVRHRATEDDALRTFPWTAAAFVEVVAFVAPRVLNGDVPELETSIRAGARNASARGASSR